MVSFSSQVAIVTGAAGNLGKAVVEAFLNTGVDIACVDDGLERLQQVYSPGSGPSNHLYAMAADLTQLEDAQRMVTQTMERFGRIDILVNTVGGFRAGKPLHGTSLENWEGMLDLNARTVFLSSQAVIPKMLRQGTGKIVSVAARPGLSGKANMAAYSASKSAVIRLTESMSEELKDFGIRVNCIIPGTIDTPQNRQEMPEADPERWVKPESLANVILFLCSEAAKDVHGAALPVYGLS